MAELVYAYDSGSYEFFLAGSNPVIRTKTSFETLHYCFAVR